MSSEASHRGHSRGPVEHDRGQGGGEEPARRNFIAARRTNEVVP